MRTTAPAIARAQSPDRDESNLVMIPPPELLGIKVPRLADHSLQQAVPASAAGRRSAWHATPKPAAQLSTASEPAEMTDLKLPPAADNDRFASIPDTAPSPDKTEAVRTSRPTDSKWRPVKSAPPALSDASPN